MSYDLLIGFAVGVVFVLASHAFTGWLAGSRLRTRSLGPWLFHYKVPSSEESISAPSPLLADESNPPLFEAPSGIGPLEAQYIGAPISPIATHIEAPHRSALYREATQAPYIDPSHMAALEATTIQSMRPDIGHILALERKRRRG